MRAIENRLAQVPGVVMSPSDETVTAPPQRSEAITDPIAIGGGTLLAQSTTIETGQIMLGGVISFTVIICAQVLELPHKSVAW